MSVPGVLGGLCVLCRAPLGANALCTPCCADLRLNDPACPLCREPGMTRLEPCGQCQLTERSYTQLYAPFLYEFPVNQMITGLKFQKRIVFARAIAEAFEPQCYAQLRAVDLLVPVPLHWSRQWRRGFNQCELILRFLRKDGLPPVRSRALRRKRRTCAQSELDLEARQANVAGAFVACPNIVEGKSIGLLDDVVTTGATVSQAGEALLSAGARSVCVFAFARAA